MSYYAVDAAGYLGDIASLGGWRDFMTWAETQDVPELTAFVEDGHTDEPLTLATAMSAISADDQAVEDVRSGLERCARLADEILILSDGTGDEEGGARLDASVDASMTFREKLIYNLEVQRNRCGQFGDDDSTCPVAKDPQGQAPGAARSPDARSGPVAEAHLRKDPTLVAHAARIAAEAKYPAEKAAAIWIAAGERDANAALANGDTMSRHSTDGNFTPERRALHETLIAKIVGGARQGLAKPVAIFSAGLPGAGKSTSLANINARDYVTINADDFKAMLPEYTGTNAGELHEESSYLANVAVRVAMAQRQNVIFDSTMKTLGTKGDSYEANIENGGVSRKISDLKKAGYIVDVRFVDVDINTSIERSMKRYQSGQERDGSGRYVPPAVAKSSESATKWKTTPRATFEALKHIVDRWTHVDNNGRTPIVVDQSR